MDSILAIYMIYVQLQISLNLPSSPNKMQDYFQNNSIWYNMFSISNPVHEPQRNPYKRKGALFAYLLSNFFLLYLQPFFPK